MHLKKIIYNVVFTLLLIYFIYHAVWGDRGINSYFKLKHDLKKSYEELLLLKSERLEIEHTANLLKSGDKDILEEYAKNILGVAYPQEKIYMLKEK
jgi:cell division protein FtsB